MSTAIHHLAEAVSQAVDIEVEVDLHRMSFKGRGTSPNPMLKTVAGQIIESGACRLTFEIITIPSESRADGGRLLAALYSIAWGKFAVSQNKDEVTLYLQSTYDRPPLAIGDLSKLSQQLDEVLDLSKRLQEALAVRAPLSNSAYEGMDHVKQIQPISRSLADQLQISKGFHIEDIIPIILSHRSIVLQSGSPFMLELWLGYLAFELLPFEKSIGYLHARRMSAGAVLDVASKVPFALSIPPSAQLTSRELVCSLSSDEFVWESENPIIFCVESADNLVDIPTFMDASITLPMEVWIAYFIEHIHPGVMGFERDKMAAAIATTLMPYSLDILTPRIIKSCVHWYFNCQSTSKDLARELKTYAFKMIDLNL